MINKRKLSFFEEKPTILNDFSAFIDYLVEHEITLTRTNQNLRGKDLVELNRLMSNSVEDVTTRTRQDLYPTLHLFYHLVLAGDLFEKVAKGSKSLLEPTDKLEEYRSLTLTEKYFFLLETLWVDCSWEKLQPDYSGKLGLYTVSYVLDYLSNQERK